MDNRTKRIEAADTLLQAVNPVTVESENDKAKDRFAELEGADVEAILDNLIDNVNDHGVTISHDGAVPDSSSC